MAIRGAPRRLGTLRSISYNFGPHPSCRRWPRRRLRSRGARQLQWPSRRSLKPRLERRNPPGFRLHCALARASPPSRWTKSASWKQCAFPRRQCRAPALGAAAETHATAPKVVAGCSQVVRHFLHRAREPRATVDSISETLKGSARPRLHQTLPRVWGRSAAAQPSQLHLSRGSQAWLPERPCGLVHADSGLGLPPNGSQERAPPPMRDRGVAAEVDATFRNLRPTRGAPHHRRSTRTGPQLLQNRQFQWLRASLHSETPATTARLLRRPRAYRPQGVLRTRLRH
mmetsp:Transcript_3745/g.9717  ORF Transcript_3745/g.9717 Transcript_3745/m.9717 type:complete len:285 (-) Transcript_3745:865-1719(-)